MHGSLAVFRRWHPEYGAEPLVSRALMLQLTRVLCPASSQAEKELAKVAKEIQKCVAKEPRKASATS
eukprot:10465230-Lingulodinium_polyedra.AAC.1